MNMNTHLSSCKRKARQIKSDYPELPLTKRFDIAAQQQGFKHYTSLKKLHELLGPDKTPSEVAIIMAGGDPDDCPYERVNHSVTSSWSDSKNI